MSTELSEAFAPATIVGLTKRLYELRQQLSALKGEEQNLTAILREYCERTGEVIEVEGLPALRPMPMSRGWTWDSHAIEKCIEDTPHLWRRLLELGCVSLNASAMRDAVKRGQLPHLPPGGLEHSTTQLRFDRK